MQSKKYKLDILLELLIAGVLTTFFIGLSTKDLSAALKFSAAYTFLYYVPGLVFVYRCEKMALIEKFVLSHLIGISTYSFFYFVIGIFGGNVYLFRFLIPVLTVTLGVLFKTYFYKSWL